MGNRKIQREIDWEKQYEQYLNNVFNQNYDFYVAVTRKGYYFSKLHHQCKDSLLRDRDILKTYNFNEFSHKRVLLFDDTVSTGETLKELKEFLVTRVKVEAADMAAFAISPHILEAKEELFAESKFYFQCLMSEEEMSSFSLYELRKIHDSMISYVIDLPAFHMIEFTEKQFASMISEANDNWKFYDYSFDLQGKKYENGFLHYTNGTVQKSLGDALLANIVKCRYRVKETIDSQKVYEVVFTPFTILKSVSMQDMKVCFFKLFKDTPYVKYLENSDEDCFIGIYRDVVYCLSCFVGRMFQKYIHFKFQKELEWNYNLTATAQNAVLEESIDIIFSGFSADKYLNLLSECSFTYWKKPRIKVDKSVKTTYEMVKDYVLGSFSKRKVENVNLIMRQEENQDVQKNFVCFEYIESLVAKEFTFQTEEDFSLSLVQIVLFALDYSFISNGLMYDDNKDEINRIFYLVECSEIYFSYDVRLFYLAIYTYYNLLRAVAKEYCKNYNKFIDQLYCYFRDNGYFKLGYISVKEFEYFSKYFDLKEEVVDREIRNKAFLLDREWLKHSNHIAVMKFVSNLNFTTFSELS